MDPMVGYASRLRNNSISFARGICSIFLDFHGPIHLEAKIVRTKQEEVTNVDLHQFAAGGTLSQ